MYTTSDLTFYLYISIRKYDYNLIHSSESCLHVQN